MSIWMGGVGTLKTPEIRWTRHKTIFNLGWKWTVELVDIDNNLEMVYWCLDNMDCIKLDAYIHGEWKAVRYLEDEKGLFYYNNTVHNKLPSFIRIGLKTDDDATAFKLR